MTVSTPSRIAEAVTAAYLRELTHVTPEPSLPTWRSAAPATHGRLIRRLGNPSAIVRPLTRIS